MAQIAISDEAAADLVAAAEERGCSPNELASALIRTGLHRVEEFQLSSEEDRIVRERLIATNLSSVVPGEVIDAKFDAFFAEVRSR